MLKTNTVLKDEFSKETNGKILMSSSLSFPTWLLSVTVMKTIPASHSNDIRREETEKLCGREVMKVVQT